MVMTLEVHRPEDATEDTLAEVEPAAEPLEAVTDPAAESDAASALDATCSSGSFIDRLLIEMQNAELRCVELESEVEERATDLKAAKSSLAMAVSRLRRLVTQIEEAREKDAKDADRPLINELEAKEAAAESGAATDADESWKRVKVDSLFPPAIASRLRDLNIKTLGKLEKQRASEEGLAGIEGITDKTVAKIESVIVEFFEARAAIQPSNNGKAH